MTIALRFWQSSMYNSWRTDPNELAKMSILAELRREQRLIFRDFKAGAEETMELSPTSEIRQPPLRDKVVKVGKLFGD